MTRQEFEARLTAATSDDEREAVVREALRDIVRRRKLEEATLLAREDQLIAERGEHGATPGILAATEELLQDLDAFGELIEREHKQLVEYRDDLKRRLEEEQE